MVTAPGSGAEIIPFLKTYVNLPAAIAFTVLYSKMNNVMSPSQVFYACITPFLAFFASFAAFIYPARDSLHPHAAADYLLAHLPGAFGPLISIFRNWTYAVFYTAAELWGSVVVSVLFWGLANQVRLHVAVVECCVLAATCLHALARFARSAHVRVLVVRYGRLLLSSDFLVRV